MTFLLSVFAGTTVATLLMVLALAGQVRQLRRELAGQLDLAEGLHRADGRQLAINTSQLRVNEAVIKRIDGLENGLRDTTFGVVRQADRESTKRVARPGGGS